jgi:hypothetical protein
MTISIVESEIPGVYTAHFLEIDLVTQGSSPQAALDSLWICWELIKEYDAKSGQVRRPAPPEYWPAHPHKRN